MTQNGLSRRKRAVLALLGGACVVLGFPPFHFFPPLLIIGPTLFLVSIRGVSVRQGALLGAVFGATIQWGGFSWLAGTVSRFYRIMPGGENSPSVSEGFWIGLGAFLVWWLVSTISWVIYGGAIAAGPRRPLWSILWIALLWMAIESLYPRIFPWHLGAGFSESSWWAQGAWFLGVGGLSGAILLCAGFLAEGWARFRSGTTPWVWWGIAVGGIVLGTIVGGVRHAGEPTGESDLVRVGYVQAAISLERRHSRDRATRREVFEEIAARTKRLSEEQGPDFVVWSEGMLPGIRSDETVEAWLRGALGFPAIIGGLGDVHGEVANRAFLLLDLNSPLRTYDKRELLLFGEKFPASDFLRSIGIPLPPSGILAGDRVEVVDWKGIPIAPSICFEGILSETALDRRRAGARLHVNLTEDLWYGDSAAPRQHLALTRMRAIEAGLPLLRVTNGGITAACDARGRWLDRIPLGGPTAGVIEIEVPRSLESPPFTQWVFRYVPFLLVPILVILLRDRRRPSKTN